MLTAGIAFVAVKNWKRQEKAKRETEFLDALVEAVHTYIADMPGSVTLVQTAKIGMRATLQLGRPMGNSNRARRRFKLKRARGEGVAQPTSV